MKVGHIHIKVRQYSDGRWGFDDYSQGKRHMVRLDSKQKAESRATDLAVLLANGRGDLLQIDQSELAEIKRWKAASSVSVAIERHGVSPLKGKVQPIRPALQHRPWPFLTFAVHATY
jgi:hypothetical protein